MGLFDKKYCDICGEKIGLLGNRKLEDGNLCKDCAKKLSPWFSERRHSTIDDIKAQLAYREDNKQKVAQFRTTRTFGDDYYVLFDDNHRWFAVSQASSPNEKENPDIIDYASVTGCRFDIDETRNEVYRQNKDGKNVSYNPPRYKYYYNFKLIINVDNPYFDEINISLRSGALCYEPGPGSQVLVFGISLSDSGVNPESNPEYRKYREMGEAICKEFDRIRGMGSAAAQPVQASAAAAAPVSDSAAWFCTNCGAQNSGKFCESCGSPRPMPKAASCPGCGWTPSVGQSMPKFCPECGSRMS